MSTIYFISGKKPAISVIWSAYTNPILVIWSAVIHIHVSTRHYSIVKLSIWVVVSIHS